MITPIIADTGFTLLTTFGVLLSVDSTVRFLKSSYNKFNY